MKTSWKWHTSKQEKERDEGIVPNNKTSATVHFLCTFSFLLRHFPDVTIPTCPAYYPFTDYDKVIWWKLASLCKHCRTSVEDTYTGLWESSLSGTSVSDNETPCLLSYSVSTGYI